MTRSTAIAAAGVLALLTVPAIAAESAKATLNGPDGESMGEVTLVQAPEGVLIQAEVSGLSPGMHGFHIHQTGSCEPDFEAAGGHYAPEGKAHGHLAEEGHHAGDLPNIHADDAGNARADFFTQRVSLKEGAPNTLFDSDGSAIVVHERMDSYGEQAMAGGRAACGVIEPQ